MSSKSIPPSGVILDNDAIARTIRRLASEIVEATDGPSRLALVGIRRGGVGMSARLAREIHDAEGVSVPVGTVDIALYRDDAATALPDPKIGPSRIAFDVDGRDVVLVDDVLQTGRTIRAALNVLFDYGRPRSVMLATLAERDGRQLPIEPNVVGMHARLGKGEQIKLTGPEPLALVRGRVPAKGKRAEPVQGVRSGS